MPASSQPFPKHRYGNWPETPHTVLGSSWFAISGYLRYDTARCTEIGIGIQKSYTMLLYQTQGRRDAFVQTAYAIRADSFASCHKPGRDPSYLVFSIQLQPISTIISFQYFALLIGKIPTGWPVSFVVEARYPTRHCSLSFKHMSMVSKL
jgi:hypothetical protein